MEKEQNWLNNRCGYISASELGDLVSASGKIIDTNVSYIRKKRFERKHGYALPVSSRPMEIGKKTEPTIFEWLKAHSDRTDLVYAQDLEVIPFWKVDWAKFGASPDCFSADEKNVFEFKTLVGNEATEFFMDEYTSNDEKKERVWKEHGNQLLGQFLSNNKVDSITVVKYAPKLEYVERDVDSPMAEWRGLMFTFNRADYVQELENMRNRIIMFDKFIDSTENPKDLKKAL